MTLLPLVDTVHRFEHLHRHPFAPAEMTQGLHILRETRAAVAHAGKQVAKEGTFAYRQSPPTRASMVVWHLGTLKGFYKHCVACNRARQTSVS